MTNAAPAVERVAGESFHHHVRNLLSRLQLALERCKADIPLFETQHYAHQSAAGNLETTFRDERVAESSG